MSGKIGWLIVAWVDNGGIMVGKTESNVRRPWIPFGLRTKIKANLIFHARRSRPKHFPLEGAQMRLSFSQDGWLRETLK